MNIYDALNLAEMNGHRASLQSDGRWFLIRKSDRAIVNIGYSIIEAVSVLVQPEPEVVEAEPVVETVETVEVVEVVADAATTEVEVVETEDDDTMTVGMAAMILNDKRCGLATEEEIDEAQGVMVRAVAAELRARGVQFADDSLQDWICAGEFRGWETAESLADEWGDSDEEEIAALVDHGYSVPEEREDEELSFIEAAELLHQASRGRVSDEMIEQARSVVINALSIDLEAREVPFQQDDLRDWVACTNFSGRELIGSLADEWINENGITAPNWSAAANEYDDWLKQNYVQYQYDAWSAPAAPSQQEQQQ